MASPTPAPIPGLRNIHGRLLGPDLFQNLDISNAGSFGKIFPGLPALNLTAPVARELANAMIEVAPFGGDNSAIPAGYTYFGQFVDHDITLDLTPLGTPTVPGSPSARTPQLDLDSVYANGPTGSPDLYEADGLRFKIGTTAGAPFPNDLPRNGRVAVIGDARNDENLIVAQLHLQFLLLHNKLIAQGRSFASARKIVTQHYQFIVLTDFLPRISGKTVVDDILSNGRQFYLPQPGRAFMPLEFSAGAYRFGHSMVREIYDYNRNFPAATLAQLFTFTGNATAPIPDIWIADWRRLFEIDSSIVPNPSRAIDAFLTPALANLPGFPPGENVLAFRNLVRGSDVQNPSGQAAASTIGASELRPQEIATGPDGAVAARHGLHSRTPLWYYILKEAQVREGGKRMGPTGARICAEVLIGLIEFTPDSILNTAPRPAVTLPHATANVYTPADLIRFVGQISPLDGI
jgi:hypothetical protein